MNELTQYASQANLLVSILLAAVGFLLIRTLNKIDASQKKLFEKINGLSQEFYELKGQHDMLTRGANPIHSAKK